MGTYNTYTVEQEEFLKMNASLMSRKALTEFFNAQFGTRKSVGSIKSWCNRRAINSSNDGKFQKGYKSWQKGLHGDAYKSHYTEESMNRALRKMHESRKTKKIGDEIIKNGEPWIVISLEYGKKYSERRVPKRRYVWEQANGKIPKNCKIIHLDGNKMNCELSNLYCLPLKMSWIMAKNEWYSTDPDITLAAIKYCELHFALKEMEKKHSESV